MQINDFIVGKWYKSKWGNYFKFKETKNKLFSSSEEIYEGLWLGWSGGNYSGIINIEVDLSEIQQYLPDGHPDKFIPHNNNHVESLIKLLENV